uniref:Uncharacterized protein n=1 Tax=Lepeophtheirus salmonis TaxID=72036 RepID=A0A0K2V1D8_LEPSM
MSEKEFKSGTPPSQDICHPFFYSSLDNLVLNSEISCVDPQGLEEICPGCYF